MKYSTQHTRRRSFAQTLSEQAGRFSGFSRLEGGDADVRPYHPPLNRFAICVHCEIYTQQLAHRGSQNLQIDRRNSGSRADGRSGTRRPVLSSDCLASTGRGVEVAISQPEEKGEMERASASCLPVRFPVFPGGAYLQVQTSLYTKKHRRTHPVLSAV